MASPFRQFTSIKRLQPSIPVAAVATVGTRNEQTGQPDKRDRFFIKEARTNRKTYNKRDGGTFQVDARDDHPDFEEWNRRARDGRLVMNRDGDTVLKDLSELRGVIAFPSVDSSFSSKFWAQALPGLPKPGGRYPACTGNGEEASRFARMAGQEPVYETIACPPDCPFLQGNPAPCKLRAALTFIPSWGPKSVLPRALMQWTTSSEQSAANALGLLTIARDVGVGQGIPDPSLVGLEFRMRITEGTSAIKRTKFPIVTFGLIQDVREHYLAQKERQDVLASGGYVLAQTSGYHIRDPEEVLMLEAGHSATLSGDPAPVDDLAAAIADATPEPVGALSPDEIAAIQAEEAAAAEREAQP